MNGTELFASILVVGSNKTLTVRNSFLEKVLKIWSKFQKFCVWDGDERTYVAIQIQSWIFKTQSKSNHSPDRDLEVRDRDSRLTTSHFSDGN